MSTSRDTIRTLFREIALHLKGDDAKFLQAANQHFRNGFYQKAIQEVRNISFYDAYIGDLLEALQRSDPLDQPEDY